MQKSFNLACFIWNYTQPSNPAKYVLLRAREAGALGLPSAERQSPARGGMSRCRSCWRGRCPSPFCQQGPGMAMGTHLPSPSPCMVPVNAYVLRCFPSKASIFVFVRGICSWQCFQRRLDGGFHQRRWQRRVWLWERTDVVATGMTCEEHLRPPTPALFSSG